MSFQVTTRVRPFTPLEISKGTDLCIDMTSTQTLIRTTSNEIKKFNFDYNFWSHSGFKKTENGELIGENNNSDYCCQKKVYEIIGKPILENFIRGYNCCLFSYGQTGSGKSYSMIGNKENPGIVPLVFENVFFCLKNSDLDFELMISMVEIYNEKVHDLFCEKRTFRGLAIREKKNSGIYIEGLKKFNVNNYDEFKKIIEKGNTNRTIASTQMNLTSSRAHTIITLECKKTVINSGKKETIFSSINLVDLAGSEKMAKSQKKTERFKEGCSINKSLSVLGKIISILSKKEQNKQKNLYIPFRDSKLTRILQNALGGNSKTFMICTLSPSMENYDESLSTLRYAERAKKIKCNAIINKSENSDNIMLLKKENISLRNQLLEFQRILKINKNSELEKKNEKFIFENFEKEKYENIIKDLEEKIGGYDILIEEYNLNLQDFQSVEKENRNYKNVHLINLNEDELLTEQYFFDLEKLSVFLVGKKFKGFNPNLQLYLPGINKKHARIFKENDFYFLEPFENTNSQFLLVNGKKVYKKIKLQNWDRIIFGISTIFLFKNPHYDFPPRFLDGNSKEFNKINWEIAENERILNNDSSFLNSSGNKSDESTFLFSQQKKTQKIYDISTHSFLKENNEKNEKEISFQKKINKRKDSKYLNSLQEQRKRKTKRLLKYLKPKIQEANCIAKELKRKIYIKIDIDYSYETLPELLENYNKKKKQHQIIIKVENFEKNHFVYWSLEKFLSCLEEMKENLYNFYQENKDKKNKDYNDPFKTEPKQIKIGESLMNLRYLAYVFPHEDFLNIFSLKGEKKSKDSNLKKYKSNNNLENKYKNSNGSNLEVKITPLNDDESPILPEDSFFDNFENPEDLLGKFYKFSIEIKKCFLPENYKKKSFVKYCLKNQENLYEEFCTEIIDSFGKRNINYCYKKIHCLKVDENILNYFLNFQIKFEIFAFPNFNKLMIMNGFRKKRFEEIDREILKDNKKEKEIKTAPKFKYYKREKSKDKNICKEISLKKLSNENIVEVNKKEKKLNKKKSCIIF